MTRAVGFAVLIWATSLPCWQVLGAEQGPGQSEADERTEAFRRTAPLHFALRARDYDGALAAMLVQQDIDEVLEDERGKALQPLCLAAQDASADAYDMVRALILSYGADPNVRDGRGQSPLHYAAANGNLAVVELLVQHGADVNAMVSGSDEPLTPLYLATRFGMGRVADFLRSYGADELDGDLASRLKVDAAIGRAHIAALERVLEEGLAFSDTVRAVYEETTAAAVAELEAAGRLQEAAIWRALGSRAAEVVIRDAPGVDSDLDAWVAVTTQKLLSEVPESLRAVGTAGPGAVIRKGTALARGREA